ncbi:MAG: transcriptional regulator [Microbacteriaceae bacterium]|nr:transcriptional regulator [Microbacteriaceae bacterium]
MRLHDRDQLLHIVPQLAALAGESEWFEFKVDNDDPETLGENVAALANSARLAGEPFAYSSNTLFTSCSTGAMAAANSC